MNLIILYFTFILFVPSLLTFISLIFFKKNQTNIQLNLPFECGFNPMNSSRNPFSIQFFLLAIIFLIFDVEITLLLPIPLNTPMLISSMKMFTMFFFIMSLLIGILMEWYLKTLDWIK